jgi:hypothetical protein
MTNVERVALHRQRKRLGMRSVPVILSEQEIDFLVAQGYELSRKDGASIGRAVSQFLSDSARLDLMLPAAEKITLVLEVHQNPRSN